MKGTRCLSGILLLLLFILSPPVRAANMVDLPWEYEIVMEWVCKPAPVGCSWKSTIYPVGIGRIKTYIDTPSELPIDVRLTILDAQGQVSRETLFGTLLSSTGCAAGPVGGPDCPGCEGVCTTDDECEQTWSCPYNNEVGGFWIDEVQGDCQLTDTTIPFCACEAERTPCVIDPLPPTHPTPPRPEPTYPTPILPGEVGGSIWFNACRAYTPIQPDGSCEDSGEPCYNCGGPLP